MLKTYSLVGSISSLVFGKAPALLLGQLDGSVVYTEPPTTQAQHITPTCEPTAPGALFGQGILLDTSDFPCLCLSSSSLPLPAQRPFAQAAGCPQEKVSRWENWVDISTDMGSTSFVLQVLNTVSSLETHSSLKESREFQISLLMV